MDFQLGGLVLHAPSLDCDCVFVPVAAAAAAPAAAEPLLSPWWRFLSPPPCWRERDGGSTLPAGWYPIKVHAAIAVSAVGVVAAAAADEHGAFGEVCTTGATARFKAVIEVA
jgi:hypothetical protein